MQGVNICVYINVLLCTMFTVHSIVQLLTLLYCTCIAEVADVSVTTKDTHSENIVQYCTPDDANVEFGLLLNEIIKELKKDETSNLDALKTIAVHTS